MIDGPAEGSRLDRVAKPVGDDVIQPPKEEVGGVRPATLLGDPRAPPCFPLVHYHGVFSTRSSGRTGFRRGQVSRRSRQGMLCQT